MNYGTSTAPRVPASSPTSPTQLAKAHATGAADSMQDLLQRLRRIRDIVAGSRPEAGEAGPPETPALSLIDDFDRRFLRIGQLASDAQGLLVDIETALSE